MLNLQRINEMQDNSRIKEEDGDSNEVSMESDYQKPQIGIHNANLN